MGFKGFRGCFNAVRGISEKFSEVFGGLHRLAGELPGVLGGIQFLGRGFTEAFQSISGGSRWGTGFQEGQKLYSIKGVLGDPHTFIALTVCSTT